MHALPAAVYLCEPIANSYFVQKLLGIVCVL